MDDCPCCIAAKAPVKPEGFPGDKESKGFVGSVGGHLETLVSPKPLFSKAFKLFSLLGKYGKLAICFEVVVGIDAFDVSWDDLGG